MLYKDPVTDSGVKRSARGRMIVGKNDAGQYFMQDGLYTHQEGLVSQYNQLQPIWRNGKFLKRTNLTEIRETLRGNK